MSFEQAPKSPAAQAIASQMQPNANDTSVAPAAPVAKNPQFEAMEKRERAFRKEQEAFKAQQTEWQTKLKSYETDYVPKSKLSADPLAVLQESGLTLDQVAELLLAQPNANDPATKAMLNKISALEEKQRRIEQQAQEAQNKQYEQAIKQINNEVGMLVDADAAYETIKALDMQEAVTELIKSTYEKEGYIMDISDAASQVETELVEQGYKMAQFSKVQARLTKPAADTTQAQNASKAPQSQAPQGVKTLSNNLSTSTTGRSSERERRERAIAAFLGSKN